MIGVRGTAHDRVQSACREFPTWRAWQVRPGCIHAGRGRDSDMV